MVITGIWSDHTLGGVLPCYVGVVYYFSCFEIFAAKLWFKALNTLYNKQANLSTESMVFMLHHRHHVGCHVIVRSGYKPCITSCFNGGKNLLNHGLKKSKFCYE